MVRWEYCEYYWQPGGVTVSEYRPDGQHVVRNFALEESTKAFACLGEEGWELTCAVASPAGAHEYWYYFKRPIGH
jgi:hypothetical protein